LTQLITNTSGYSLCIFTINDFRLPQEMNLIYKTYFEDMTKEIPRILIITRCGNNVDYDNDKLKLDEYKKDKYEFNCVLTCELDKRHYKYNETMQKLRHAILYYSLGSNLSIKPMGNLFGYIKKLLKSIGFNIEDDEDRKIREIMEKKINKNNEDSNKNK